MTPATTKGAEMAKDIRAKYSNGNEGIVGFLKCRQYVEEPL